MFSSKQTATAEGIVALFNASDDTIDMIQTILKRGDSAQALVWCHFADLKEGQPTGAPWHPRRSWHGAETSANAPERRRLAAILEMGDGELDRDFSFC